MDEWDISGCKLQDLQIGPVIRGPARPLVHFQIYSVALRQCVNHQSLGWPGRSVRDSHRNVLLPVFSLIRHRHRGAVQIERRGPQFLSGLRIKCTELSVVRCCDEDQAAGRRDGPAASRGADVLLSFRQAIVDAERNLPGDIARIHIHRDE